jgi:hypothetical protein
VICHPVAGIVLNFGLKGIDEPVEAAYQQRHMLMGREETHVFTTFQVGSAAVRLAPRDAEHLVVLGLIIFVFTLQIAFIGVFLMFLFSGGTASVTPLMCKRGSVSLVFRALHSCGTPVRRGWHGMLGGFAHDSCKLSGCRASCVFRRAFLRNRRGECVCDGSHNRGDC